MNRWIDDIQVFFQLDDDRLGEFFLESPGCEESSFVKNQIMKYVGWLRRTAQPTDSEVNMEFFMLPLINTILQVEMGLRLKSPSILESIRNIIETEEQDN